MTGLVRDHRAATAAACIAAIAFTFSIVSPALGGPSIRSIAKTAKKALSTARTAKSTAGQAHHDAGVALNRADAAVGTANGALGVANAGAKTVTVDGGERAALPLDFAEWTVNCPPGYAPTGHGAGYGALEPVFEGPVPTGYIASMFNPSTTSTYSGNFYVVCVKGTWSAAARRGAPTKATMLRRRVAAERAVTAER